MADEAEKRAIARKVAEEKRDREKAQQAEEIAERQRIGALLARWTAFIGSEREQEFPGAQLLSVCTAGTSWWSGHKHAVQERLAYCVGQSDKRQPLFFLILPETRVMTKFDCLFRAITLVEWSESDVGRRHLMGPPYGST